MPSNYTPNYSLNQWEPDDRVQRTDFNADNVKIDAAIKAEADARAAGDAALSARVDGLSAGKADKTALDALSQRTAAVESGKADKTALNALSQTMTGKGNCEIVMGSYVGTGTCGESHPCTLTFGRRPMIIFLASNIYEKYNLVQMYYIMLRGQTLFGSRFSGNANHISWSGNSVSWHGGSAKDQFNEQGTTYEYIALLI